MKKEEVYQAAKPPDCPDADGDNPGLPSLEDPPGADTSKTRLYLCKIKFRKPGSKADYVDEPVACDKQEDCGGHDKIHLLIVAERKAHKVDWVYAVNPLGKSGGYITAMIVDMDNITFKPFNLAPKDTAYQWVGPINPANHNVRAVAYYTLKTSSGVRIGGPFTDGRPYTCGPEHPERTTSAVHLNEPACPSPKPLYAIDSSGRVIPGHSATRVVPQNGGLWVSCKNGCCQVGQTNLWYTSARSHPALRSK